jgi:hypothetical protein
MVRAAIHQATALRRKPTAIPDSDRTSERDRCADWLEAELIDGDREWMDTTILSLAEASEWSREHISRVLGLYFEPRDSAPADDPVARLLDAELDVDGQSPEYRGGYSDGFAAGVQFALQHPDLFVTGVEEELPEALQR